MALVGRSRRPRRNRPGRRPVPRQVSRRERTGGEERAREAPGRLEARAGPASATPLQPPARRRVSRPAALAGGCALVVALLSISLSRCPAGHDEAAVLGFARVLIDHPFRSWLALSLLGVGLRRSPPAGEPGARLSPSDDPLQERAPNPSNRTYDYGTLGLRADYTDAKQYLQATLTPNLNDP